MASTFKDLTSQLKNETEEKSRKLSMIKIPYAANIQGITDWCCENIGAEYVSWALALNAHHYVLFIPKEDELLFKLRW